MSNKPQTDDLVKDLQEIVRKGLHRCRTRALRSAEVRLDHIRQAEVDLMTELSIYISNRDQKILQHGIKVGKDSIERKS